MASHKNYQQADKKNANVADVNKKRRNLTKDSKTDKFKEGTKLWTGYFRANPHRFVKEYLQIRPFSMFQCVLLYMMFQSEYFMFWASRGLGKSYITAIYCIVRCILYPNTNIVLASGVKSQAQTIITQKIQGFYNSCPMVKREIVKISTTLNDCGVDFRNGSWIRVVSATDNARGYRANTLVIDEFRMVSETTIKNVLTKFLTSTRKPPFVDKLSESEREKYREPNTEIYLSSCWYKDHWSWAKFLSFKDMMFKNDRYFTCGLPYQLGMKYGVLDKQRILDEMEESNFDIVNFQMEMGALPQGESEDAYFKYDQLHKSRTIKTPLMPLTDEDYIKYKGDITKSPFFTKKLDNEIRVIGMDVALMGSANGENDASSFTVIRCIPEGDHYRKFVVYCENMEGEHTDIQALRLKTLYYDLECDYVVLDTAGVGLSIYDSLVKITEHPTRGITYPAWMAFNDENMGNRALDDNAIPVVYSMKVSGGNAQQTNHEMAMYVKRQFSTNQISLLCSEIEAKDHLPKIKEFNKLENSEKMDIYMPFIHTNFMISEMVQLQKSLVGTSNTLVKLKEKNKRNRKDRYSSLAYTLYFIRDLEQDLFIPDYDEKSYYEKYLLI